MYYQLVVEPELTATRSAVWVGGTPDRVVVGVDEPSGVVTVSGGRGGLSQLIATDRSLFVLAADVAAQSTATWIEVPWSGIGGRPGLLRPDRVAEAFSIGPVECAPLDADAVTLVFVLLDVDLAGPGRSLCGARVGPAADRGENLLVDARSVRPSELPRIADQSVMGIADVANASAVLASVSEWLHVASR